MASFRKTKAGEFQAIIRLTNYLKITQLLSPFYAMWIRQNYLPTIDLAIMLDVYHALDYPKEFAQSILAALKPNGKLVLVEYRAEDAAVPLKQTHKMTQAQVIKALTLLPLKWEKPLTTCLGSM